MIADDDPVQRAMFEFIFTGQMQDHHFGPFGIDLFSDGRSLIQAFLQRHQAGRRTPLAILDLLMPGIGGLETAERLRTIDPDICIIIITSHDDVSYPELVDSLGRDVYFMIKPLRVSEILAQVHSLILGWNRGRLMEAAVEEARHSRRLLQSFVRETPAAIAMLDADLRYIERSRRWIEDIENHLTGEMPDRSLLESLPYLPEEWKAEYQRCLKGDEIRRRNVPMAIPGGSTQYFHRHLLPWRHSDGTIGGIIIFSEKVTEKWLESKARQKAERDILEKQTYLDAVLNTVQTAVLVIDPETWHIVDANPWAAGLLDCPADKLIGRDFYEFREEYCPKDDVAGLVQPNIYRLRADNGRLIYVRRSVGATRIQGRRYLVISLLDITDIRRFINKQDIHIDLARHLLNMVNPPPARYTPLNDETDLFFEGDIRPCFREGGDHVFLRTLRTGKETRTIVSIKDQSGHEVGCVLRSIATDLIHQRLMDQYPEDHPAAIISKLNRTLMDSCCFSPYDFFTGLALEINHETLELQVVSFGHPPLLLIRGNTVRLIPGKEGKGRNPPVPVVPDMRCESVRIRLEPGDRILLYTDGLLELPGEQGRVCLSPGRLARKVAAVLTEADEAGNPMPVSRLMRCMLPLVAGKETDLRKLLQSMDRDDITVAGMEIEPAGRRRRELHPPDEKAFLDALDELFAEIYAAPGADAWPPNVRLAFTESMLNAWRHGAPPILAEWRIGNDFLFSVKDHGPGFDPDSLPDPRSDDGLLRSSGRGVFMIRQACSRVWWTDDGRIISGRVPLFPPEE